MGEVTLYNQAATDQSLRKYYGELKDALINAANTRSFGNLQVSSQSIQVISHGKST